MNNITPNVTVNSTGAVAPNLLREKWDWRQWRHWKTKWGNWQEEDQDRSGINLFIHLDITVEHIHTSSLTQCHIITDTTSLTHCRIPTGTLSHHHWHIDYWHIVTDTSSLTHRHIPTSTLSRDTSWLLHHHLITINRKKYFGQNKMTMTNDIDENWLQITSVDWCKIINMMTSANM